MPPVRRLALIALLLLPLGGAAASPEEAPKPAAPATTRPWIDPTGTSIVGFGLLRLVPPPGKAATFEIAYQEKPGDYGAGAGDEFQLFVLPGDAFATKERAFADEFLAFTRTTKSDDGDYALKTSVVAASETTVIVAYGPWTAPDAGRPPGDVPTFRLDVTSKDGAFEWLESEMGELITTNWTNRPEVKRGGPCRGEPLWIEVRPMILYDGRMVRDPTVYDSRPEMTDRSEEADDFNGALRRSDRRIAMMASLAERFRRVPIRWR
jgi:hypothetical protein